MVKGRTSAFAYHQTFNRLFTHEAKTTYGVIGVKVWVFQGEIRKHKQ